MVEKAFGLPSSFSQIDIDKQAEIAEGPQRPAVRHRTSLTVFQDEAAVDKLIDRFLARAQIEQGAGADRPGRERADAAAGHELASGSSGLWNLLASRG